METLVSPKKQAVSTTVVKRIFPVTGMSCASCAASVTSILNNTPGVIDANVNFATAEVSVAYQPDTDPLTLQQAVQSIGYDLVITEEDPEEAQRAIQENEYQILKNNTIWAAILTLPVFFIGMFYPGWGPGRWVSLFLAIPVMFWFGRSFFVRALAQARHGKANMDTLVALSTFIAFVFSLFNTLFPQFWLNKGIEPHVYYEAATVIITFISLGKLLEEKAKSNASVAIKKLMGLQPKTVIALRDGVEQEIPVASVVPGDILVVRPGEKVPVDGLAKEGSSFIDESMITGEPVPVEVMPGKKVYAGTINQKGSFRFEAQKVGSDTLLAQIIRMVREAQGSKAPVQRLADKIAGIFVPVVMGISIVTFLGWMIFGGAGAFTHALLASITVLVIACPCALGLATPTAIMVGIGKGAENNILIKDAESLELASKISAIVLDKTGTITEGKPQVTAVVWKSPQDENHGKSVLLALEKLSEHPLAGAVVNHLKQFNTEVVKVDTFNSITGRGVGAVVHGNEKYYVGSRELLKEKNIDIDNTLASQAAKYEGEARTVIFFADEKEAKCVIAISDKIKDTSARAIRELKQRGIEPYMLTGDHPAAAAVVAKKLGITHYKGGVLPAEKAAVVEQLQQEGKVVAMVGDGINDSHAMARADVSIAMGKGSDIAMDVAKITLITSDLMAIPAALKLSDKTRRGVRQNLFWAFIYNLIGIPLAAGVLYPAFGFLLNPMIAGAAMAFSSVSVVSNSLRLKFVKL